MTGVFYMNSFDAKNQFLGLIRGERKTEDAAVWIPRCFFSFKQDGQEVVSDSLKAEVTSDGLKYEIAEGVFLHLNIREFPEYPALEYTPVLENTTGERSPRISDFRSLDLRGITPEYYDVMKLKTWHLHAGAAMRIRANMGSQCVPSDFFPADRILYPRTGANTFELTTTEGRPSAAYLPFFGVDFTDYEGFNVSIGWSGAWRASAFLSTDGSLFPAGLDYRVESSLMATDFRLEPGEKLTLPSILLQFRSEQKIEDAQNLHRRLLRQYFSPRDSKGNLIKPPVSFCTWGGQDTPGLLERIRLIKENKLPYEVFWMDAGWMGADAPCPHFLEESEYQSDWPQRVGNWKMNRHAHPDGLKPVSDAARDAGMKMLLWMENERICKWSGAAVITEHPEWLLSRESDKTNYVLNLGIPEASDWIANVVGDIMEKEGIDNLRVDFNINTLPFWHENDVPNRIGITEIRYVEGLRRTWANLRKRFPDMFIDNCASGGRRLDYVLAQYGFPLCQSDFATFGEYQFTCVQLENYYLTSWLPLHASLHWYPDVTDSYATLSAAGGATGFGDKIWQFNGRYPKEDHPMEFHRERMALLCRLRDIQLRADYYPLTPDAIRLENWCASQFHDPEKEEGYLLAFRRTESVEESKVFPLRHIQDDARYKAEFLNGEIKELSGKELRSYAVTLPPHSVELMIYSKV